jgi:hypothetical protein
MIKNPTYTAELVISRCSIELLVNGVPTFNSFEEGTVSVDWNLNLLILKNGIQNLMLTVMPLKGENVIREKAIARIKIVVRESVEEFVPQDVVTEEHEINFLEKQDLPFFVYNTTFSANIPNQFQGWKNSIDLSNESKEKLFSEVIQWNKKLLNIHHNFDIENYLKVFDSKNKEVYKALYLTDKEIEDENKSVFNPNDKNLVSLQNDLYKLEFFAENKLVSVRLPYELPGFRYDPEKINDDAFGFSLNIYFHRPNSGSNLEIIR